MKDMMGSLSDEDIDQIARLIDKLDESGFEFLQLDVGTMKLTIGKGAAPLAQPATGSAIPARSQAAPARTTPAPAGAAPSLPAPSSPPVGPAPASVAPPAKSAVEDGTVAITAPLMGMFYSKPDPSSSPFVTVGAPVSKGATVCLVEVMKVFNSVPSHLDGTITEVCARDAEPVEAGQVLFRVRPAAN